MDLREYVEFEIFIENLFKLNGFSINSPKVNAQEKCDFIAILENQQYAVEVKHYKQPNMSLVRKAVQQLSKAMQDLELNKGLLVISALNNHRLDIIADKVSEIGITILTREDLFNMSANYPELTDKLSSIVQDRPDGNSGKDTGDKIRKTSSASRIKVAQFLNQLPKKKCLCSELNAIPSGKPGWAQYENKCTEILKELFEYDLTGWHQQQRTDDGLNRFDLVTRIRSASDFWSLLANDIGSRYVIFEFKNYKKLIDQGQVLTTEKYLHKSSLRTVAFIISRVGAKPNAIKLMQGSMRENGKLIISLTNDDLCEMLKMKDNGDDPNDYMFQKVDDFLMSLPR
ncbi:restriction endonuclease [Vibrio parahaemolyticus]